MPISLSYANAQAVAYAVHKQMVDDGIEPLMSLPYNRFEPANSLWWINPSKENPAFRHGKYAFLPDEDAAGEFFCGMHVEKGFGPAASMAMTTAKEKRNLMKPNWLWHQFVADLKAGKLDAPVEAMCTVIHGTIEIEVGAYYYKGGEFDPYASGDDWDVVNFAASGGRIVPDGESSKTPRGLLTAAAKADSLSDLGKQIASVPDGDWVWINFWIGANFELDATGKMPERWDAHRLWKDLLIPLRPWFV